MAVFHEPEYRVEESVLLRSKRTASVREVDIMIYHFQNPSENILVECRDHRRKQDVQWIDELYGKAISLSFNHVVAVSGSGFTKYAIEEATERGIETIHLKEAEEKDWKTWHFGLKVFGLNILFKPVIKSIGFVVPPPLFDLVPKEINNDHVWLADARIKQKIKLRDWVKVYQNDENATKKLLLNCENNKINSLKISIPCDLGVGFCIEPENRFIQLEALLLDIELIRAEYSIPLRHINAGENQVLLGDQEVLGFDTRLVVHDKGDSLKVMIEQKIPK